MAEARNMSNITHAYDEPEARIEQLVKFSKLNSGDVDHHIPPDRYYYYGLELLKRANAHHNDGHLEKAYSLYINFINLFTEKIHKHPACHTVASEVKALNERRLKQVLIKEKLLKEELLNIYQEEYDNYHKRNWEMQHNEAAHDGQASFHHREGESPLVGPMHPPMPLHEFIVLRRMGMFQNKFQ